VTTECVEIHGITIPFGPHITPSIAGDLHARWYEDEEAQIILQRLEPEDVVIELGGGIGYTSALCAKRIDPANVHVYEADPRLEGPIRELYALNDVEPDLQMHPLGAQPGTFTFHVAVDYWFSSFVPPTQPLRRTLSVEMKSFEQEMDRHIPRPNFLIVDIEGGEYDLLLHASLAGIDKLACEVHEDVLGHGRVEEVRHSLHRRGFILDDGLSTSEVWYLERPPASEREAPPPRSGPRHR
jgi:FkbM family methyltransferase